MLQSRKFLTFQWRVHAAHLIKACVALTADDLWQILRTIWNVTGVLLDSRMSPGQKKNNKSLLTFTRVWPFVPPSFLRSTNIVSISLPSQATSLFLWPLNCDRVRGDELDKCLIYLVLSVSKGVSYLTSSTNLAWPCCSTCLMAFCSKPTEPGYNILLPNEWTIRKLQRKIKYHHCGITKNKKMKQLHLEVCS